MEKMNTTCNDCVRLNESRKYPLCCKHCNALGLSDIYREVYICDNCGFVTSGIKAQPIKCIECVSVRLSGNVDKPESNVKEPESSLDDKVQIVKCKGLIYYCTQCSYCGIIHSGAKEKFSFECYDCGSLRDYTGVSGCDCCNNGTDISNTKQLDANKESLVKDKKTSVSDTYDECIRKVYPSKVKSTPIVPNIKQESSKSERCEYIGHSYQCHECKYLNIVHYVVGEDARFNCAKCNTILVANYSNHCGSCCRAGPIKVEPMPVVPTENKKFTFDKQVIPVAKSDMRSRNNIIKLDHKDTEDVISIGDKMVLKVTTDDKNIVVLLTMQNVELHYTFKNE